MAITHTLADKPFRVTVLPQASLSDNTLVADYVIKLEYMVTTSDGENETTWIITAEDVPRFDPTKKDPADFVPFDDLTECPSSLYDIILGKFNDEGRRASAENVLDKIKTLPVTKDCPW